MPSLDEFQEDWEDLTLLNGDQMTELNSFLTECIGEVGGGLFFYNKKGDKVILKCEEGGHCLKKVDDTGDEEKDWKWIGDLVYPDGTPFT